jgi:hypothetical protein
MELEEELRKWEGATLMPIRYLFRNAMSTDLTPATKPQTRRLVRKLLVLKQIVA